MTLYNIYFPKVNFFLGINIIYSHIEITLQYFRVVGISHLLELFDVSHFFIAFYTLWRMFLSDGCLLNYPISISIITRFVRSSAILPKTTWAFPISQRYLTTFFLSIMLTKLTLLMLVFTPQWKAYL